MALQALPGVPLYVGCAAVLLALQGARLPERMQVGVL